MDAPGDRLRGDGGRSDRSSAIPGTWVTISPGTFMMGSLSSDLCRNDNETRHQVTLTRSFRISVTEVTQGQFQTVMGYNPSGFTSCGADCPVENVDWHEAAAYCNVLSARVGLTACYTCSGSQASVTCAVASAYSSSIYSCPGYRLPTEAEFEYAYRAGTNTAYYNGTNNTSGCNCNPLDSNADAIAWYCGNASNTTHQVGQKQVNPWGLYDMAGNAFEWCNDWWSIDLGTAAVVDPNGVALDTSRVIRGGSWYMYAIYLRAAGRAGNTPTSRDDTLGFRCVKTM